VRVLLVAAIIGLLLRLLPQALGRAYRLLPKIVWYAIVFFYAQIILSLLVFAARYPSLTLGFHHFLLWPTVLVTTGLVFFFGGRAIPFRYLLVYAQTKFHVSREMTSVTLFFLAGGITIAAMVHYGVFNRYMRITGGSELYDEGWTSYYGRVTYDHDQQKWLIREKVLLSGDPDDQEGVEHLTKVLQRAGWTAEGSINGRHALTHERTQGITTKWYKPYTLNTISFSPLSPEEFAADSRVELFAPRHMVGVSWPPVISRREYPDGDREVLKVALSSERIGPGELQVQIFHPLLRNSLGMALLNLSIWEPLKWFVIAFFAIVGEQVRLKWISPFATRVFRLLSVPKRRRR